MGQLITQGALPLSLILILIANPRGIVAPNVFLGLVTVAGVVAMMVSIHSEFMAGSTFRATRYMAFVLVLWLFTPWFRRRDMILLRAHRLWLWVVIVLVVGGAMISPGLAFSFEGRLSGVLWPIPPTQVAHYAAILAGTTVVLWLTRVISSRNAALTVLVTLAVLVGTHTRTALIGLTAGLLAAAATLFLGSVRVRRTSILGALAALAIGAFFASELSSWALRGQSAEEAGNLTGRTKVWSDVIQTPRPLLQDLFGSGLSNLSWKGLPIDSNWVATYVDQGLFGLATQVVMVVFLLVATLMQDRGPHKAIAIFIIVYCLFSSITETGMANPSPYWLDLTVAAAMLGAPRRAGP